MNPVHWSPAVAAAGVMALFFILIIVYGTLVVLHGRRERRQFDLDIAWYEGKIEANRARSPQYSGRHAATWDRLSDDSHDNPAIRAETGPLPAGAPRQDQGFRRGRKTGDGLGGPSPTTQPRQRGPQRVVTTAADIAPVIYPHGATEVPLRPQAASEPGRRTAAMKKLTDTGWMRAIEGDTNEGIHHMNADGEQYRREYRRRFRAHDAAPRPDGPAPARTHGAGPLDRAGRIVFGEPQDRPEMLP